jgi:hypothetical protein
MLEPIAAARRHRRNAADRYSGPYDGPPVPRVRRPPCGRALFGRPQRPQHEVGKVRGKVWLYRSPARFLIRCGHVLPTVLPAILDWQPRDAIARQTCAKPAVRSWPRLCDAARLVCVIASGMHPPHDRTMRHTGSAPQSVRTRKNALDKSEHNVYKTPKLRLKRQSTTGLPCFILAVLRSPCRDGNVVDEARAAEMHRGEQPRRAGRALV